MVLTSRSFCEFITWLVCLLAHEREFGVFLAQRCRYNLFDGLIGFGDQVDSFTSS